MEVNAMRLKLTMRVVTAAALAFVAQTASAQLAIVPVQVASTSYEEEQESEATTLASTMLSMEDRIAALESQTVIAQPVPTSSCNCGPIASTRISTKLSGCPTNYGRV